MDEKVRQKLGGTGGRIEGSEQDISDVELALSNEKYSLYSIYELVYWSVIVAAVMTFIGTAYFLFIHE